MASEKSDTSPLLASNANNEVRIEVDNKVNVENRKNKIHCGRWDGPSYWFFKVICPIISLVHFLYSLSDKTGLEFWVPISFGLFASWLNSLLSLWKSYRLGKLSKFTDWGPSEWKRTLVRWIFHLIPLSSICWEWDVLELRRECAAKSEGDDDEFVRLFDRLVSISKQHTFLENIGNTFGQGPQLFFSLYLISQAIHSKLDPLSDYGWWMDVGEVLLFSIPACACILVCNRTGANLAKDEEKEMSTKHIVLLFTSLYLILLGLFTPRAMLSAHSTSKFWILFSIHVALICIGSLIYYWLVKSARRNVTKNVLGPAIAVVACFFSFAGYRSDQVDFHDGIYYAAPFLMNLVMLIVLGLPSVSTLYKSLYFFSLVMHSAGLIILHYCSTFPLDVSNVDVGGSTPSSSNSIWTPLTYFMSCFCNFSVGFYSLVSGTSSTLLSWFNELRRLQDGEPVDQKYARIEAELDEQQPAAPVHSKTDSESETGVKHRHHPPPKEWKDMHELPSDGDLRDEEKKWKDINELLSDGDLGDEEKNAIRRKDLNWICDHVTSDLFQILNLMLPDKNGAEVNARYNYGMTPALRLCKSYEEKDLSEILKLLIDKGADVNAVDIFETTMLHFVCTHYKHDNIKDVINLLIKNGVPVDAKDQMGQTALHKLALYYHQDNMKDVVELLIDNRVPVDAKDHGGDTALHGLALKYSHDNMKDVVALLIKKGVPVDAKNEYGYTALHLLFKHYSHANMKDVVDLLLQKGVPVNAKDNWGNTALHYLFGGYERDNFEEIVNLLKDNGARLDVQNDDGCTPLMWLCGYVYNLYTVTYHIGVFSLLTPDASNDPLLSDTIKVTRLLKEFDEKKISPKNLADELKQIHKDVIKKCRKEK